MRDKTISALVALALCPGDKDSQNDICHNCEYSKEGSLCAKKLREDSTLILKGYQLEGETQTRLKVSNPVLYERVTQVICEIGIPAHLKGYDFVREAIILVTQESLLLGAITKELYPRIAKKFHCTPDQVERSMRHAIAAAWSAGDPFTLRKWFGPAASSLKRRPSNSEFVATVADRLRWELGLGRTTV